MARCLQNFNLAFTGAYPLSNPNPWCWCGVDIELANLKNIQSTSKVQLRGIISIAFLIYILILI